MIRVFVLSAALAIGSGAAVQAAIVSFSGQVTSADISFSSLVQVGDDILFAVTYDDSALPANFNGFANLNPAHANADPNSITVGNTSFLLTVGGLSWGIDDFSGVTFEPALAYQNGQVVDVAATLSKPTGGLTELSKIIETTFGATSFFALGNFDVSGVDFDAYNSSDPNRFDVKVFAGTLSLDPPSPVPLPAPGYLLLGAVGLLWIRRKTTAA